MHPETISVLIATLAPVVISFVVSGLISGMVWRGFTEMLNHNLIVTPQDLEKKHREILEDMATKFISKEMANAMQRSIDDTNHKVTSIYEMLIDTRNTYGHN